MEVLQSFMDVSIAVVNYNTKELALNCINSVIEKTGGLDYEIILADNNSSDNSVSEIQNRFPSVKVLALKENIGFGRANNECIKNSKGKYIFCLNPDTILVNNAVKILFDFMEAHPDTGAAGGNLYDKDMNFCHAFGYGDDIISLLLRKTFLKWLYLPKYLSIKNYEKNADKTKVQEVNHITGADLMLRRSVIEQTGLFNEKFFLYFEETELEVRIRRAGYKIFFVPESKIIHLEGKNRKKRADNYFNQSFIEYYRLCFGEAWAEIAEFLTEKKAGI